VVGPPLGGTDSPQEKIGIAVPERDKAERRRKRPHQAQGGGILEALPDDHSRSGKIEEQPRSKKLASETTLGKTRQAQEGSIDTAIANPAGDGISGKITLWVPSQNHKTLAPGGEPDFRIGKCQKSEEIGESRAGLPLEGSVSAESCGKDSRSRKSGKQIHRTDHFPR